MWLLEGSCIPDSTSIKYDQICLHSTSDAASIREPELACRHGSHLLHRCRQMEEFALTSIVS